MLSRQGPEAGDVRRGLHTRKSELSRKHGHSRTPVCASPRTNSWNPRLQSLHDDELDARASWGFGETEAPASLDGNTAAWHIPSKFRGKSDIYDEKLRDSGFVSQARTTEWVTSSATEELGSENVSEHQAGFFLKHRDDDARFKALQKASMLERGHKQWTQSDQALSPLILNGNSEAHKPVNTNLLFNLEGPLDEEQESDYGLEWADYARASNREASYARAGSRSRSPLSSSVGKFDIRLPQVSNARNNSRQRYSKDFNAAPSASGFFDYEIEAMGLPCRKESGKARKNSAESKEREGRIDERTRGSCTGSRRRSSINAGHRPSEQGVLSNCPPGGRRNYKGEPLPFLTELEDYNCSDDYGAASVDSECRRVPTRELPGELELVACDSNRNNDGRLLEGAGAESLQLSVPQACKELALCDYKPRNLSQKYRPKAFEEVVGQHIVAQALSSAIQKARIAPVYLFQGSRGTGKTSAARIFAAALLCVSAEGQRPCGACRECTNVAVGKCSEVREVDAASNNGVERVKALLEETISAPTLSRYKVFIIDECHVLTAETWNCLLKILEEPPMNVVFILITTESDQLPRTVVSRCQRFPFARIKDTEIVRRLQNLASLEDLAIDAELLHLIASRSEGSLRDAETILDQVSLLGEQINSSNVYQLVGSVSDERLLGLLNSALVADTINTVRRGRELIDSGVEPLSLISRLAALITDILAGNFKFSDKQRKGFFQRQSLSEMKLERLRIAMKTLSEAEKQLRTSNDRSTWLIAALLQLGPDPSPLFAASYVSSISQSPIALDENEAVDFEHRSSGGHTWPDGDKEATVSPNLNSESVLIDNRNRLDDAMYEQSRYWTTKCETQGASKGTGFSLPSQGQASSSTLRGIEKLACPVELPDEDLNPSIEQRLNPSKLNDIWCKVVERCQSTSLRQLLYASVRLLSISISEVDAVVHLEIFNPEDNASCGRSQNRIANLFKMVLGFPVEVKMSLASLPAEAESPKTPEDGPRAASGSSIHNRLQREGLKGWEWDNQDHSATKISKGINATERYPGTQLGVASKNDGRLDSPSSMWRHTSCPEGERLPTSKHGIGGPANGECQETQINSLYKMRAVGPKTSSGEQQARHHASCKDVQGNGSSGNKDLNLGLCAEDRELDESELLSLELNELDDELPEQNWRARHSTYEGPVAVELQDFDGRRGSDAGTQRRKGSHLNMVRRMSMRSRIRSLPSSDPNSPERADVIISSEKDKDGPAALEDVELARDAGEATINIQKRGKLKGSLARFFQGKLSKQGTDNQ